MREKNPSQYFKVTDEYLRKVSNPQELEDDASSEGGHPRNYGPALASQLGKMINSVLSVKLSGGHMITYDLHRLHTVSMWKGFLDLSRTQHMRLRGEGKPFAKGDQIRGMENWHWAFEEGFKLSDYKNQTPGLQKGIATGPLDKKWMDYHGHYLFGNQVILSYNIQGREVLEMPAMEEAKKMFLLSQTLRIDGGQSELKLSVSQMEEGEKILLNPDAKKTWEGSIVWGKSNRKGDTLADFFGVAVIGDSADFKWETDENQRVGVRIPAGTKTRSVRFYRFSGSGSEELERYRKYISDARGQAQVIDLKTLTQGGPGRWGVELTTQGQTGKPDAIHYDPMFYKSPDRHELTREKIGAASVTSCYEIDTLTLPTDNPWNAWMRMSSLDFFDDGRCAVSTYGGDIWIVSGIDQELQSLRWRRFATGLFEPMGIKILNGEMFVICRDRITRLHDLNGDGEADFYESFYADPAVSSGFHAYNFDLHTDSKGNFYYVKPGRYTDYLEAGSVMKISPDGKQGEIICTGFRVPNGFCVDPKDRIFVSDNQGQWTPASKISLIQKGGFYGLFQTARKEREDFDPPMIWFPQAFDNSCGGQIWVDDKRWGPLSGRMVHTSFGKGWMYYLMIQEVDDTIQAAAVSFPFQFDSGLMRARVNPADGQVYAVGLTGWDTESTQEEGCFQRLRYTGDKAYLVLDTKVRPRGINIGFSFELDDISAQSIKNYSIEQWNYRWLARYGSDHWSVADPDKKGHDPVEIDAVELSRDKRSVYLKIPEIGPVQQMSIRLKVKAADGRAFQETIYLTINKVPSG